MAWLMLRSPDSVGLMHGPWHGCAQKPRLCRVDAWAVAWLVPRSPGFSIPLLTASILTVYIMAAATGTIALTFQVKGSYNRAAQNISKANSLSHLPGIGL